jgi:ABC-type branched-subunit amino acid transport system substrate-binding protein
MTRLRVLLIVLLTHWRRRVGAEEGEDSMTTRQRLLLAMLAAFALVAAACGSDDDAADDSGGEDVTQPDDGDSGDDGNSGGTAGVALDVDALLSADLSACAAAPSGDPITVGMAMDFSDVGGFVDIPGSQVVPFAAEKINCAGGIGGRPVEVEVREVGDDAALATEELLDAGAQFIIGPPFADFALPILQTTGGEVPFFPAASTEPTLADPSANSYLVSFDDIQQGEAAAEWAYAEGITRAILFTEGEGIPYTGVIPDAFAAKFTELGGEIVSSQNYVFFEDTDFSAQVNEIVGLSENNEIIFSAMAAFQFTALKGQLDGQNLDGLTYFGADAMEATRIQDEANNEGFYYTPHLTIEDGDTFDSFLDDFEAANGSALESPGMMPLYVDALMVGLQAISNCGCSDPVEIGAAVGELNGFEGLTGTLNYVGSGGIPPKDVAVAQVNDNVAVRVGTISAG